MTNAEYDAKNDISDEGLALRAELHRFKSAINLATTAMMSINRDFEIDYVNDETLRLLESHSTTLRALYPGFSAERIVGTCIDVFHKVPSHQRNLLADPANLPFKSTISVGPLKIAINVAGIRDANGGVDGWILSWDDITEKHAEELRTLRIQSAVDNARTAIMMTDLDMNITYVNDSTKSLLNARIGELRLLFPSLDVERLVGASIDMFHNNPAHQRRLLSDPANLPWQSDIKVGPLTFDINVRGVFDLAGQHVGCSLEWADVTDQRDGQEQVDTIIASAVAGQLDRRIETSQFTGFMRDFCEGVNSLVDAIVDPMEAISRVANALSEGDLTQSMDGEYQGQFAVVQESLNGSVETLSEMVEKIMHTSNELSAEASTISRGNTELNNRTQEQAASLEETAAAVEEMTSTTRQSANNATSAKTLSREASELANRGGEVVGRAVSAMEGINSASKKISDIIGVIDEIAFQTNILALNAAVEAARAGEQGRGFAVVASEVRSLAQRSASAAKEIKGLIQDSVEKVAEGSSLVNESGQTLNEIVKSVDQVSRIVEDIASASEEQSSGVEAINQAVLKLDEMTQKNVALVEEAAATSGAMDVKAQGLLDLVSYFDADGGAQTPERVAPAAQRRVAPRLAPAGRSAARRPAQARTARAAKPDAGDAWSEF
ncbi:MAG: PAS domain-containing protein [Myxococcales bacterium]|nr:PAS domain-containing protein [Myxococcales bacterium]